ncbi:MAG: DUF6496 domain-containing protein [Myxococcales bacterium]
MRDGKHGARSAKQAIAIGLSKARRAGVKLARGPALTRSNVCQPTAKGVRSCSTSTMRPPTWRSEI